MLGMVIVTLGSVLVVAALNSPERWPAVVPLIGPVVLNQFVVLLPYVALMACMSVLARSARQATIYAVIAWILVSLASGLVQDRFGPLPWIDWLLPGVADRHPGALVRTGCTGPDPGATVAYRSSAGCRLGGHAAGRPVSVIACADLTRRFGRTRAIDGLTLTLEAGRPIALVGANGAGKTTLLKLLCGFVRPGGGNVRVLGEPPGSAALRGRLACMPQDAAMHPHVSIGRQLAQFATLQGMGSGSSAEADRVLELVQLREVASSRPGALSHGMRKRVTLAQALIGSPELVLLDEPTAGIDPPNVKIIRDIISAQADRATFIISSHNLDELERLCETVVTLAHGKLTGQALIGADDSDAWLTVHAPAAPEEPLLDRARQLPGVTSIEHRGQGEYRLRCEPASGVDCQLLALFHEQGWQYRSLVQGRSLEDRLYG